MLDIVSVIKTVVEVAGQVHRHLTDRQKAKQEAVRHRAVTETTARIQQLEESDLRQAELLDEISRTVADLGKAIAVEVEKNRTRDAWVVRLVYLLLGTSVVALGVSLIALFH